MVGLLLALGAGAAIILDENFDGLVLRDSVTGKTALHQHRLVIDYRSAVRTVIEGRLDANRTAGLGRFQQGHGFQVSKWAD